MSPIDENELRDELWFAEPASGPQPDALGAAVVARGRAVRRRRVAAASVASLAVVALAGAGIWNALPRTHTDAVPAQTPSASASPSPTPSASPTETPGPTPSGQPTPSTTPGSGTTTTPRPGTPSGTPAGVGAWTDTTRLPGNYGDLGTFKLPGEGGRGWAVGDRSSFACGPDQHVVGHDALRELEASRQLGTTFEGEGGDWRGILVFRTEAAADEFMFQVRSSVARCVEEGLPATNPEGYPRFVYRYEQVAVGDDGFAVAEYDQLYMDGEWKNSPGGWYELWARDGRAVTVAGSGGEYVGNIITDRPDVVTEQRAIVDEVLKQTCRWTSAGC